MKSFYSLTFFLILCFSGLAHAEGKKEHKNLIDHIKDTSLGGLNRIVKERYLRVLTSNNSFDYFIHNGEHRGLQWEMMNAFLKHLNKKYVTRDNPLPIQFEMVPVAGEQLIPMLLEGKGDIITTTYSVTENRKQKLQFTRPYREIDEVVLSFDQSVTQTGAFNPKGKTFHIKKSSSYFESIKTFNETLPKNEKIKMEFLDEQLETENIIELVSLKKIKYTIVDSHLAKMAAEIYDGIYVSPDKHFGQEVKIAWAVRPEDKKLLAELNKFIPKYKEGTLLGNIAYKKYFEDIKLLRNRILDPQNRGLSNYDDFFKKYGKKYGFDWKILAAIAYQESRFKQDIVNKWGAIGIFQIKQSTANEPYIKIKNIRGAKNAENNIHAGVKYLHWIKSTYFDKFKGVSEKNKLRMTMAAYNAGPTAILEARILTKKMGLNPNKWFRNVEMALLSMRKVEPVKYVSEINKRYTSYLMLKI